VRRTLAIIVAIAALMLPACINTGSTTATSTTAKWEPIPGAPFEEPEQIQSDNKTLEVQLVAGVRSGTKINVSGSDLGVQPFTAYSGGRPLPTKLTGPTLRVKPGDTIKVTFVNQLGTGARTNIHYHGLHVDPKEIGDNIFRTFDNGKTYQSEVTLPDNHRLGTYWYHVHYHGISDEQVMGGLAGLLIVEGIEQLLPPKLRNVPQRQLAFQAIQTCIQPQGNPPPPLQCGDSIVGQKHINFNNVPSTRLVNGLYQPTFSMKSGQYELWRLANTSSDVFYLIRLEGHEFNVIAESGTAVSDISARSELLLPPGQRFDVLVLGGSPGQDRRQHRLLSLPYAQHADGNLNPRPVPTSAETLATVTVTAADPGAAAAPALPEGLVPEQDLSNPAVVEGLFSTPDVIHRRFRFLYGSRPFRGLIQVWNEEKQAWEGEAFKPDMMPIANPVVGTVEEWTLENHTSDDHPFHIHVNDFQVLSVNGRPYDANGLQDVVNIPKQYRNGEGKVVPGEVVIRSEFTDFTGWFVFHCHILQHEDLGMMATVQVRANAKAPTTPPPEVHGSMPGHGAS
jgi:suppressor of ftsI